MKLVKVIDVPVRYKGVTHPKGAEFEMEGGHINESLVEVIGEVAEKQTDTQDSPFEGMSMDELKNYAAERNIDIGKATTEEGIIKKIEEAQKTE
ncbi:hypothetical protein [Solibacillus sp. FSL K6-1523]|uniref:hypothetical protein n=1 Tax=Solibacillus sp. FSL K6-1523 TaxID=2921471 RepID=UPI0030F7464E